MYLQTGLGKLQKGSRELFGPGREKLFVKGTVKGNFTTANSKETTQENYIVENLKEPLLGWPAMVEIILLW